VIVHSWCVHVAVSTENALSAVRATRNMPTLVCTSAAEPTLASGEEALIGTVTTPLATEPLMLVNWGVLVEDGDVGPPPPQACNMSATPATAVICTARKQKSLRFTRNSFILLDPDRRRPTPEQSGCHDRCLPTRLPAEVTSG